MSNILLSGQVRDPSIPAQTGRPIAPVGRGGDLLVGRHRAKYANLTSRGYVFCATAGSSSPGQGWPIYNGTSYSFVVINPEGSGVNLELLHLEVPAQSNSASETTGTVLLLQYLRSPRDFNHMEKTYIGSLNSPTSVYNCLIGSGRTPKSCVYFFSVGWTAQTDLHVLSLGGFYTTNANGQPYLSYDFDGAVIVPPGTAISYSGTAASTAAGYLPSWWYAELPV